jgi:Trk K+ transport system NAD-binding subunit
METKNKDILRRRLRLCVAIFKQFKTPIFLVLLMMLGGGYLVAYGKQLPLADAIMVAFAAVFFEHLVQFPFPWYIQIYFYISPIIGIYLIADGISILFNILLGKRNQLQEWWNMIASTYQNHIVVCGVGKVGYRIINELLRMGELVVGVEQDEHDQFVQELLERKVPIIIGNVRIKSVLERANVKMARAVICATSDDMTNIDCALNVRTLKPDLHVVVRIFDDTIANKMSTQFHLTAISTSYAAAPVFVSQALELETPQANLTIQGHSMKVTHLQVNSKLAGKTVAQAEAELKVKVLAYKGKDQQEVLPSADHVLQADGKVVVIKLQEEREEAS